MSSSLKQSVNSGLRNLFGVEVVRTRTPVSFDEGWAEERDYWLEVIRDFYKNEYGLDLHESQTDQSLVPPLDTALKIQRANKADADGFFASGYRAAMIYQTELCDYGSPANRMQNILEMGVGLGRLIIHYFPFKAKLYGCDVTPEAAAWTRSKLGHRVEVETTGVEPPLPYPDGLFDFVYANSVFTHVPCSLMDRWAAELQRIIRPGGFLIFSVLDANHYLRDLTYREFHRDFQAVGCRDWAREQGVLMLTYLSRESLFNTWGKHFRVLELRTHYRELSHLICQRAVS
ncbi:MAG TPA: class I SAM-dependent methyltransferase [Pyrinomonadaceae bacterium]|jgi:SAM-dependent methyltransferase|nr:class I SAM-dependent methyltransferase [Pyrinomonadaceae bacterium]